MNKSKKIIDLVEGIADDTPILPDVIAGTVIGYAIKYLHQEGKEDLANKIFDKQDEYVQQLVGRAEKWYETPQGKKKLKAGGNKGRNLLYSFMQHWLSSYMRNDLGIEMPQSFSVKGEPL